MGHRFSLHLSCSLFPRARIVAPCHSSIQSWALFLFFCLFCPWDLGSVASEAHSLFLIFPLSWERLFAQLLIWLCLESPGIHYVDSLTQLAPWWFMLNTASRHSTSPKLMFLKAVVPDWGGVRGVWWTPLRIHFAHSSHMFYIETPSLLWCWTQNVSLSENGSEVHIRFLSTWLLTMYRWKTSLTDLLASVALLI